MCAQVCEDLIRKCATKAADHMDSIGFPVQIRITGWLATMGLHLMPLPQLLTLWDWMIVVGPSALIVFIGALVESLEPEICRCRDFQVRVDIIGHARINM